MIELATPSLPVKYIGYITGIKFQRYRTETLQISTQIREKAHTKTVSASFSIADAQMKSFGYFLAKLVYNTHVSHSILLMWPIAGLVLVCDEYVQLYMVVFIQTAR